jgi:hypothetical protein
MGRLLYMPSIHEREQVRNWASTGAAEEDIAVQLDIPVKRVRKLFRRELQLGEAGGKQRVLDKLHEVATSGSNITAMIFWVKSKCGWRDSGASANTASPNWPPFVVKWNGN